MAIAAVQPPQLREATSERLEASSIHMDMTRGIAALVVMLAHQRVLFLSPHTAKAGNSVSILQHDTRAIGMGHYSVVVFFVLSGFLVGGSAIRSLRQGSFSWLR